MILEYELDPITLERTGRVRRSQWLRRTMRWQAVPPSQRGDAPFLEPTKQSRPEIAPEAGRSTEPARGPEFSEAGLLSLTSNYLQRSRPVPETQGSPTPPRPSRRALSRAAKKTSSPVFLVLALGCPVSTMGDVGSEKPGGRMTTMAKMTVDGVVAKIKAGALGEGYSVREESLSDDGLDVAKLYLTRYGHRRCGYIIVRGDLIDVPGEIDASAAKIAGMSESSVVEVLS